VSAYHLRLSGKITRCLCKRLTILYFIACFSFSVIFSLRATMLINLNLNLSTKVRLMKVLVKPVATLLL